MTAAGTRRVVVVGDEIPLALFRAVGCDAERVSVAEAVALTRSDEVAAVAFSSVTAGSPRAFQRALLAQGGPRLFYLDLPLQPGELAEDYALRGLREFSDDIAGWSGRAADPSVLRDLLREEWAPIEPSDARPMADDGLEPVVVSGPVDQDTAGLLRSRGLHAVWNEPHRGYAQDFEVPSGSAWDPLEAIARTHAARVSRSSVASARARADALAAAWARADARAVVFTGRADDAEAWFRGVFGALHPDIPTLILEREDALGPPAGAARTPARVERPRARKVLESTDSFGRYQREWFAQTRARVEAGEPFVMVNADAPQEMLRAMDIPFVINQWWASVAAAKGGTSRARAALTAAGYPPTHATYNSQGLADHLASDGDAPWGGLPTPSALVAMRGDDAVATVFEEWGRVTGAEVVLYDRTRESRTDFPTQWWELMPREWESVLEHARIDYLTEQLRASIATFEALTGRALERGRLEAVLDLVNEQEEWYRRARDLIAATTPAPISVVDSIPATMIPQWHRGTEWGRDAARSFYLEVKARVDDGVAVCTGERLRLMWAGVGLWQHMWLYQAFEESHGAVFVWSIYLGLAADGYARYSRPGDDPLRALAARFLTMGDELGMPAWASQWYLNEAKRNGIDAVVALSSVEPEVIAALERAGYPVLVVDVDNLAEDVDDVHAAISGFLDGIGGDAGRARQREVLTGVPGDEETQ